MMKKIQVRAAKREKRRQKLKQDDEKAQVQKSKKLIGMKGKSGEALEMAKLQNKVIRKRRKILFKINISLAF